MNAVMEPDDNHLFDLERARQREAQRKVELLGNLLKSDYQYDLLQERARQVAVPSQPLRAWSHAYREHGIEGLLPTGWLPPDAPSQDVGRTRRAVLGDLPDTRQVTEDQILSLAPDPT